MSETMTRAELIEKVYQHMDDIPFKDVESSVKIILETMTEALMANERIEIRGFGSFELRHREPRVGRNPKTGESVLLPAKHIPHFKPGKELREQVDANK